VKDLFFDSYCLYLLAGASCSANVSPNPSLKSNTFLDLVSQHWKVLGSAYDVTTTNGGQSLDSALVDFSAFGTFVPTWDGQISTSMSQQIINLRSENYFMCTNQSVSRSTVQSNSLSLSAGGKQYFASAYNLRTSNVLLLSSSSWTSQTEAVWFNRYI
jgi:hypothetical protein